MPSKPSWDAARATLSSLQRPNILGSCTALRDSLNEARKGLPVPDQKSNTALRNALDLIGLGTEDCFEGARGPNIPQLEKSFSELREGDTLLDTGPAHDRRLDLTSTEKRPEVPSPQGVRGRERR